MLLLLLLLLLVFGCLEPLPCLMRKMRYFQLCRRERSGDIAAVEANAPIWLSKAHPALAHLLLLLLFLPDHNLLNSSPARQRTDSCPVEQEGERLSDCSALAGHLPVFLYLEAGNCSPGAEAPKAKDGSGMEPVQAAPGTDRVLQQSSSEPKWLLSPPDCENGAVICLHPPQGSDSLC